MEGDDLFVLFWVFNVTLSKYHVPKRLQSQSKPIDGIDDGDEDSN